MAVNFIVNKADASDAKFLKAVIDRHDRFDWGKHIDDGTPGEEVFVVRALGGACPAAMRVKLTEPPEAEISFWLLHQYPEIKAEIGRVLLNKAIQEYGQYYNQNIFSVIEHRVLEFSGLMQVSEQPELVAVG